MSKVDIYCAIIAALSLFVLIWYGALGMPVI